MSTARPARRAALLLAVWSLPGLISVAQVMALNSAVNLPLPVLLAWQLPPWWCWGAATVALEAVFARRLDGRRVAAIAGIVTATAIAHAVTQYGTGRLFTTLPMYREPFLALSWMLVQKFALLN